MRILKIFIFMFVEIFVWCAFAQSEAITLSKLLDEALRKSPQLIQAQSALQVAELEKRNAQYYWLPTLDLTSTAGRQGARPNTYSSSWISGTSLTLTETLYNNGENYKNFEIAKLNHEVAKIRFEDRRNKIILDVSGLYFDHCVARRRLAITEKYSEELNQQLKWISDQFRNGLKTRKDYLRFKSQNQRGELELIRRKQAVEKSRISLYAEVGWEPHRTDNVSCPKKLFVSTSDLNLPQEDPELPAQKIIKKQNEISDLRIAISRRNYWPQILLTAQAQYGSSDYIETGARWQDNESQQWSALVTLNWNLWDWGTRKRNIEIQVARENSAQAEIRRSAIAANKEWKEFQIEVNTFLKAYKSAKDIEEMEQENFKVLEQEYRMGRVGYLELITALSDYLQAQSQAVEYDYELQKHYLKTQYYLGRINENIFN